MDQAETRARRLLVANACRVLGARGHLDFVPAIRGRDVAEAENIMRTHVERTAGRVKP